MPFGYSSGNILPDGKNHYAVVVFLPEQLDRMLEPLRERFDPDYSCIASHVSLVFPFETNRTLDEVSRQMRRVLDPIPPVKIELDSIGDFYPNFPLIYWEVKRNASLDGLYKALYAQLDLALPHKSFCPHVTVAKEISEHRVVLVKEQIVPSLFETSFTANSVDLVAPLVSKKWVSIRTFSLSGSPAK